MTNEEFRDRRSKLGLTQAQMAELLGVKENTVYRWESDRLPIAQTVALAVEMISQSTISKADLVGNEAVTARVFGSQPQSRIVFNLAISENTKLVIRVGYFKYENEYFRIITSEQMPTSEPFWQVSAVRWK